jgi:hypothetical protein
MAGRIARDSGTLRGRHILPDRQRQRQEVQGYIVTLQLRQYVTDVVQGAYDINRGVESAV